MEVEEVEVLYDDHGGVEEVPEVLYENQGSAVSKSNEKIFGNKKSGIWNFFEETDGGKFAKCHVCLAKISRGGTGRKATTSSMRNHLRLKHTKEFAKVVAVGNECKLAISKPKQPAIDDSIRNLKGWDITDQRARELHLAIGEMIAVDNMPIAVVENIGFRRVMRKAQPRYCVPGRTYFTESVIPQIFERCKTAIEKNINLGTFFSMTTDIWTANNTNDSFISFTVHFLEPNFDLQRAVLNVKHFPGSHTGEAIGQVLLAMLSDWKIGLEKVHLLLRDSAANIIKGARDAKIPSEPCFLHTLQLVIKDSIDSQRIVHDVIANCRKIVAHFKHSPQACSKLKNIQKELGIKTNKLVQDVATRWNSSFYMLESIHEQKRSLTAFATDYPSEIKILDEKRNQWSILEGVLSLLQPFEEITKIISESESCISEVIPSVETLKLYLQTENLLHFGVGSLKDSLKNNLSRRFEGLLDNTNYTVATFLDPRYKLRFFPSEKREHISGLVFQMISESTIVELAMTSNAKANTLSPADPPLNQKTHSSFWDCFEKITSENPSETLQGEVVLRSEDSSSSLSRLTESQISMLKTEMQIYTSAQLLDRKESTYLWWKQNKTVYPSLSKLAVKYLSAPASSVYSERLFSETGRIYEDSRNRLLPCHGEYLAFLNYNLKLVNFKY